MAHLLDQSPLAPVEGIIAASQAARDPVRQTSKSAVRLTNRVLITFGVVWLITIIAGTLLLLRHAFTQGQQANAPAHWPAQITLPHTSGRPTIVMFVHPNCPCSRASMSELTVLAANCQNTVAINIVFIDPPGLISNIESTDLWQSATHISGATLIQDADGSISRDLGAATSGQVFLFDGNGDLRFSGGITDSRGHAGNNAGRMAVESILRNQPSSTLTTPVFGCALW